MEALRCYALSMRQSPADADDLVQDTITTAIARWLSYTPGTNLKGWLFALLHNMWTDRHRMERNRRRLRELHAGDLTDTPACTPGWVNTADSISPAMQAALEKLSAKQRAVIERVGLRDMTYAEVARELRMPVGSVMSTLHRAREKLAAPTASIASDYGIRVRDRAAKV